MSDQHPFQSPRTEVSDLVSTDAEWRYFRKVFFDQRHMMLALFSELLLVPVLFVVAGLDRTGFLLYFTLGVLVVAHLSMAVLAFRLATSVYNWVVALLLGSVVLVPFLGLLAVRVLDDRATGVLKKNGVKLG